MPSSLFSFLSLFFFPSFFRVFAHQGKLVFFVGNRDGWVVGVLVLSKYRRVLFFSYFFLLVSIFSVCLALSPWLFSVLSLSWPFLVRGGAEVCVCVWLLMAGWLCLAVAGFDGWGELLCLAHLRLARWLWPMAAPDHDHAALWTPLSLCFLSLSLALWFLFGRDKGVS